MCHLAHSRAAFWCPRIFTILVLFNLCFSYVSCHSTHYFSLLPLRLLFMMSVHDDASVDSNSYDSLLDFNWRDKTSWRKETWRGPLSTRVLLSPRNHILPSLASSSEESLSEDSFGLHSSATSSTSSEYQASMSDVESLFSPPPPIVRTPSPIDSQWLLSEDSLSEDSVGPHSSPTSSISSLNEATMSDGPTIDNRRKHPSNQSRSTPAMNQPSQESAQDSPLSPCPASARRRIF
jgi:hypothetical protein